MRLPLYLALLDRWHVVLGEKVVQRPGHEVLQSGVSTFAGLNKTRTRFEISVKPSRNVDLPFPAVLRLTRNGCNRRMSRNDRYERLRGRKGLPAGYV